MKNLFKAGLLIFIFPILAIMLAGCAPLGREVVYKSDHLSNYSVSKLGYSQLLIERSMNRFRPEISQNYEMAVNNFFTRKNITVEKFVLPNFKSINKINTADIKLFCKEYNLDGFLCTKVRFNTVHHDVVGISEDAYVEMKLFDKNGKQIVFTRFNTLEGHSYMVAPKAEKTIKDGVIGALQPVYREIKSIR